MTDTKRIADVRIIAQRRLRLWDEPERDVRVLIGQPEPDPESSADDHRCPYQVIGIGDQEMRYGYGVDGIQALELVISRALPAWLGVLKKEYPTLGWEDADTGDFGFLAT